jgi:hypothetical protein
MARHASPLNPTAQRALIALATATAALGAGAATASAGTEPAVDVMGIHPASLSKIDQNSLGAQTRYVTGSRQGLKNGPARRAAGPKDPGFDVPLTGLTGPVAQTGPVGAVPTLEQFANLLGGGGGATSVGSLG